MATTWAQKAVPKYQADAEAKQLGISTDQLYQYIDKVGDQSMFDTNVSGPTGGSFNAQQNPGGINWSKIENYAAQQKANAPQQPAAPAQQPTSYYQAPAATMSSGTGTIGGNTGGSSTTSSGLQPEQVALQQMAQIDPTSEALRKQLGSSYLSSIQNPANINMPNAPVQGAPSATDVNSYLNVYGQVDPTGLAGRQQLEQALTSQAALGSKLDPETAREVEQQTRLGQSARGNIYGTPQLVEEAMTRGQAGLALQNQRQQALQGFYSSGQDVGSVANQLYQQGQTNYLNQYQNYLNAQLQNQANTRANQAASLGYLTSGATPYQVGSTYLTNAENRAASAAQGGVTYNPASLGQTYTGQGAGYFPDYGLNTSQNAQGWYNSLSAYNNQGYGQQGGGASGAALGALGGAASGALTGSAAGPWGTLIGAGVGALGGAVKGYSA